jgi:hypothetical protein
MNTNIYFWPYFTQFFLEWEIFHTKVVEKAHTHFMFNNFFWKSCRKWDNVEKYSTAGQTTDDSMAHAHRMLDT